MWYREFPPRPELRRFISRIWWISSGGRSVPAHAARVLPDGAVELVLNLATPLAACDPGGERSPLPRRVLIGQLSRALVIEQRGAVDYFGVRFRPAGAWSFLGAPADELAGRRWGLDSVLPGLDRQLAEAVGPQPTPGRRVAAIEECLLRHLRGRQPRQDAAVEWAARAVEASAGSVPVGGLAAGAGLSVRQLERRFAGVVGLPPKLFARVVRFRHVCRAVEQAPPPNWARVAARFGYADQSYLIRDFHKFAGECPTRVFTAEWYEQSSVRRAGAEVSEAV